MTSHLFELSRRIEIELIDIEKTIARARSGWQEYQASENDLYLDSVALNLHNFYNGLERLLERIATGLDNHLPSGNSWHKELLKQMASEVPAVRPRVISNETLIRLDEYCRFRHVVRNIYSYDIEPERLKKLVDTMDDAYNRLRDDLMDFADWLAQF